MSKGERLILGVLWLINANLASSELASSASNIAAIFLILSVLIFWSD